MLTSTQINSLITAAQQARSHALAFKSKHAIGAAILSFSGEIYSGCNIDAIISSQGICAESAAINHAIVHGNRDFIALAVADDHLTYPCGACLQYLTQFSQISGQDIVIIVTDMAHRFLSQTFNNLLRSFSHHD